MTRPPFGRPLEGNRWDALAGVHPATPPTVSVIVAHYEQPEQLARVLAALARQTHPRDRLEVIVVDDGSSSPPVVPPGVRLIVQEDLGFRLAAARNRGVEAATGDVLCFLDADTVPEPEYVERLVRLPALAPEVVAVGRRRHADLAGADPAEPIEVLAPLRALDEPAWLADEYRRTRDLLEADDRSYRFVIGAVLACSRWFAREVGGFDESFTAYGGEDWEWAWRCWLAGAAFAHVPDAVAWHDGPDWGGRGAERGAQNAETRMLSRAIPVAGSRPLGLITGVSDLRVVLAGQATADQALMTVDSVLRVVPHAQVEVPDEHAAQFADDPRVAASWPGRYRVDVEVVAPCRLEATGVPDDAAGRLADLIQAAGVEFGTAEVADESGALLIIRSSRDRARAERWGESGFARIAVSAHGRARRLPDAVSLAAHFGDWM